MPTLNGHPFKGTVTFKEVTDVIFTEVMGFQFGHLYSVRMSYSGCPVICFKLKEKLTLINPLVLSTLTLKGRPQILKRSITLSAESWETKECRLFHSMMGVKMVFAGYRFKAVNISLHKKKSRPVLNHLESF